MAQRLSVSGDFTFSINDPFFQKIGGGVQAAYAFSEPFSLVLRCDFFDDYQTENAVLAKQVLTAQLYATHLNALYGLDLSWTPVYGKFAIFNRIMGFNIYFLAGGGAVKAEQGYLPAADFGLGERIFLMEWLSFGVEGRYLFYVDHAAGGPSTLQRPLLISALLTFWTPAPGGGEGP
jgi:outer membrane beta-barrel protein